MERFCVFLQTICRIWQLFSYGGSQAVNGLCWLLGQLHDSGGICPVRSRGIGQGVSESSFPRMRPNTVSYPSFP